MLIDQLEASAKDGESLLRRAERRDHVADEYAQEHPPSAAELAAKIVRNRGLRAPLVLGA